MQLILESKVNEILGWRIQLMALVDKLYASRVFDNYATLCIYIILISIILIHKREPTFASQCPGCRQYKPQAVALAEMYPGGVFSQLPGTGLRRFRAFLGQIGRGAPCAMPTRQLTLQPVTQNFASIAKRTLYGRPGMNLVHHLQAKEHHLRVQMVLRHGSERRSWGDSSASGADSPRESGAKDHF